MYYIIPFIICPSLRSSAQFPTDSLSIYLRGFILFCINAGIGNEWSGTVNEQNMLNFDNVLARFHVAEMIFSLKFVCYMEYLDVT